jgi:hypothetical protein
VALDTRKVQLYWTAEEDETILHEWEAALRPCGQARWGFILHLAGLLPHRTPVAIKHRMVRLMQAGRIPRQRERSHYQRLILTPAQAGWLAGIMDGEGSIRKPAQTIRYGHMHNGYIVQIVVCYNTDLGIVRQVQALVPAAKVFKRKQSVEGCKPIYHVQLSGYDALTDFLNYVLPYLAHTEKRIRAQHMLAFIEERHRYARHV